MDFEKYKIGFKEFESKYKLIIDEIYNSYEAVVYLYSPDNIFKVVWQRKEYSKQKEFIFIFNNMSKREKIRIAEMSFLDCDMLDVICCTPETVYDFLNSIYNSADKTYMNKKYIHYREYLREAKE